LKGNAGNLFWDDFSNVLSSFLFCFVTKMQPKQDNSNLLQSSSAEADGNDYWII